MSPRRKNESYLYLSLLGFFVDKPSYGYEVYKYLSSDTAFFKIWHLKRSQFYGLLERLFNENYLEHEIEVGGQYPDRRIFSITEIGLRTLKEWMVSPVEHGREMRQDFLVKLFVLKNNFPTQIEELVQNQRDVCLLWKKEQETQLNNVEDHFQKLLISYRKMQIQSMIEWLELV